MCTVTGRGPPCLRTYKELTYGIQKHGDEQEQVSSQTWTGAMIGTSFSNPNRSSQGNIIYTVYIYIYLVKL